MARHVAEATQRTRYLEAGMQDYERRRQMRLLELQAIEDLPLTLEPAPVAGADEILIPNVPVLEFCD